MPQYKNYAGQTVTCPKQEGTCWQPDHLTKEQIKIQRKMGDKPEDFITSVGSGISGDETWVSYDSYSLEASKWDKQVTKGKYASELKRPTHTAGAAIYDMACEALNLEQVLVSVKPNEEDGREGTVTFATSISPTDDDYLDGVKYSYETKDGNTTFYKKKSFGRKEKVNHITIQKDIAKARDNYNRWVDARAASSG